MGSALVRWSLSAVLVAALVACGGGGSEPVAPRPSVLEGRLIDSAVAGVSFKSLASDGTVSESGVTDSDGKFRYRPGERVAFSIGDLVLPTVTAAEIVTPRTLAGTQALDDPRLNNILTLLQSLDADGNPSNGITINAGTRQALTGPAASSLQAALEGDPPAAFAARAELTAAVAAAGPYAVRVDPLEARRHFAQTLAQSGDTSPVVTEIIKATWDGVDWLPAGTADFFQGQSARIRVIGQSLPTSLEVVGTGACSQYVRDAEKSSATQAEFTCTPSETGALTLEVKAGAQTLARLSDEARARQPIVALSAVTWENNADAKRLLTDYMVGVPIRIRARHVMADEPVVVSGTGACSTFVRDSSASSSLFSEYLCTPSASGALTISASAAGQQRATLSATVSGTPIVRLEVTVPAQAQALPPTLAKSGWLDIALVPGRAPITVLNFLRHVEQNYYDGTVFHRVYQGFMIQAGGYTFGQSGYFDKPAIFPSIALERTSVTGLSNVQFSVAMARTNDPDTATSEFFINVEDNSASLDAAGSQAVAPGNGYAVFGGLTATQAEQTQAIDLLNAILLVPKSVYSDRVATRPLNPPVITQARRIR